MDRAHTRTRTTWRGSSSTSKVRYSNSLGNGSGLLDTLTMWVMPSFTLTCSRLLATNNDERYTRGNTSLACVMNQLCSSGVYTSSLAGWHSGDPVSCDGLFLALDGVMGLEPSPPSLADARFAGYERRARESAISMTSSAHTLMTGCVTTLGGMGT